MAGNFAGFIVKLLSSVGEFLTGLFAGAGEAGSSTRLESNSPTVTTLTTTLSTTLTTLTDTFTHTHDGITHSHPTIVGN